MGMGVIQTEVREHPPRRKVRIYLSSTFATRHSMRRVRDDLEGLHGDRIIQVTSTWIDTPMDIQQSDDELAAARDNFRDLARSTDLILFPFPYWSSGKSTELGYAAAANKHIWLCDPPEGLALEWERICGRKVRPGAYRTFSNTFSRLYADKWMTYENMLDTMRMQV